MEEEMRARKNRDSLPDGITHPSRVGIGDIGKSEGSTLHDYGLARALRAKREW